LGNVSDRQRIATLREFDGGRTVRWFGVLGACALFWALVIWAGMRLI
jgi:hypothetical protein